MEKPRLPITIRDPFDMTGHPLPIALDAAVPLAILELQACGGPDERDYATAREAGTLLAEKGDVLQFGSKKKGEAAEIFAKVARGLAVLTFCPGGVTLFGRKWEVAHEDR